MQKIPADLIVRGGEVLPCLGNARLLDELVGSEIPLREDQIPALSGT